MRRVDAEHRVLLGEEAELLERKLDVRIVGMALDVGIELRGEEVALDHVAFELGHVDPVGGEAAKGLVKRGRDVADLEDEGGEHQPVAALGPPALAREYDEAGGRM